MIMGNHKAHNNNPQDKQHEINYGYVGVEDEWVILESC
jgi:hypothetical protein